MANEKQRKTFLSYSRVNTDFAKKLAKELKAEGFDVWLDQLDIPLGARWDVELEKALEESEIFMIIMTPDSISSENVRDEIGYAIDNGKRFLPIMLENCNVPLRLRRFQYVDFSTKSFEDGVESAKQLLRGLIAQNTIPRGKIVDVSQDKEVKVESKVKADTERKEKEEAERLAAQKKAESDRKAREEAEHLAAQKAEADKFAKQKAEDERVAKARAETERKEKEEADRLAAQKAEADKLAKQKAENERRAKIEADRKAKEEADRLAAQKVVPVGVTSASATGQNKPMSKGLIYGVIGVAVIAVFGIGYGIVSNLGSPPATKAPVVATSTNRSQPTATKGNQVAQPTQTKADPFVFPTVPIATQAPASILTPVILTASKARSLYESGNFINPYLLAQEQLGDDAVAAMREKGEWIPVTLSDSAPVIAYWGWCAINEDILQDNLLYIDFIFKFDDKTVPASNLADRFFTSDGWACYSKYFVVDQWVSGEYRFTYGLTVTQNINDGENDYEKGSGGQRKITLTVP